jgi:hypothetical protein
MKNKTAEEKAEIYKKAAAARKKKFYVFGALDGKVLIEQFDSGDEARVAAERNPNAVVGEGRMKFVRPVVKTAWEAAE